MEPKSASEGGRLVRFFTWRAWLVVMLLLLVFALVLGANLVLLGYAQPRDDPVGQLTPARLMQIQRSLPNAPRATHTTTHRTTPTPTPAATATTTTTTGSAPPAEGGASRTPEETATEPEDERVEGEASDD